MSETKPCPYCAEEIKVEAIRCKHCATDLADDVEEIAQQRQHNDQNASQYPEESTDADVDASAADPTAGESQSVTTDSPSSGSEGSIADRWDFFGILSSPRWSAGILVSAILIVAVASFSLDRGNPRVRLVGTSGSDSADSVTLVGTSGSDSADSVTTDGSGNIYVAGTVAGGLGGQTYNGGSNDGFVAKFDDTGDRTWVRLIGSSGGGDSADSVTTDGAGNIYVAGRIERAPDGENNDVGTSDGYVAKFNGTGDRKWMRRIGTSSEWAGASSVTTDGAENIYVVGNVDSGLGGQTYNGGSKDGFVAKFDGTGDRTWVRVFGTSGMDFAFSVKTGSSGNIYVAGGIEGELGGQTYNGGSKDGFVAKFDGTGDRTWVRVFGGSGSEIVNSVTTNGSGNIYVSGHTTKGFGGETYNGGSKDGFVAKFDDTGDRTWVRLIGSSGRDLANSVTTDGAGNIYVAVSKGGLPRRTYTGSKEEFVAKFDQDAGSREGVWLVGTSSRVTISSVTTNEPGNVYVAGDTESGLDGQTYNGGDNDGFVKRMK